MREQIARHPAFAIVLTVLAIGAIADLTWALWPRQSARDNPVRVDARYVSQSGSAQQVRRVHVENRGDEDYDTAVETCAGVGLASLARKYGMRPRPAAVAARFAAAYDPAFRPRVKAGCLHGLLEGG